MHILLHCGHRKPGCKVADVAGCLAGFSLAFGFSLALEYIGKTVVLMSVLSGVNRSLNITRRFSTLFRYTASSLSSFFVYLSSGSFWSSSSSSSLSSSESLSISSPARYLDRKQDYISGHKELAESRQETTYKLMF